ncbi:cation-binding protein [candidate division WOR-3 bacterium]|uniref:Cation-binding protein n=1 Tax=candidate division WOR-3 bacterium TaxID=2052148 RepID=A0A9D5K8V9_UNCW3|nr:cation-binding protein [candidate division WOR-3 bacterium]MBD3364487.1 cation-binding protein [candidate division WOR-3 bacterium]
MIEHRLIERIIPALKHEVESIEKGGEPDPVFIEKAVDFFRTYADRTHHGKEEDILFRELSEKKLNPKHKKIMDELIDEHRTGRKTVKALLKAKELNQAGRKEAVADIVTHLKSLIEFYPRHIEKEDKHFFISCMEYFSDEEKDAMLEESFRFDRRMIHEHYETVIEELGQ